MCQCIVESPAACRRTPISAPIREPRHTTWPYLHVCTRGGSLALGTLGTPGSVDVCRGTFAGSATHVHARDDSPWYSSFLPTFVCCSCSGTCAFSHTRAAAIGGRARVRMGEGESRESLRDGFVLAHLGVNGTRFFGTGEILANRWVEGQIAKGRMDTLGICVRLRLDYFFLFLVFSCVFSRITEHPRYELDTEFSISKSYGLN